MNKKCLKISLHYITNFKPQNINLNTNIFLFQNIRNKQNQIICRNLFLFFLFLKSINKQQQSSVSIFIKPKKNPHFTVLRAPYRYKLARYQYGVNRYYIVATFFLTLYKDFICNNINQIFYFLNICRKFYPWFETNICFQHRCVLFITFNFSH